MVHIHEIISNLNDSIDNLHNNAEFIALHAQTNHLLSSKTITTSISQTTTATTTSVGGNLFTPKFGAGIGAGCAMLGATGVGIGQGYTAGEAVEGLARNPKMQAKIRTMMLIGAAIAESSAIYALIISILLIFVAPGLH